MYDLGLGHPILNLQTFSPSRSLPEHMESPGSWIASQRLWIHGLGEHRYESHKDQHMFSL